MTIADTVTRGPVKKVRPAPVARTVKRRNVAGEDLGSVDLEPSIFGIEPNLAVLHQVVTAQLAAIRSGTQSTKTRAQVRGGGAKPFAQKGTGRARQGSSRSPSMSGGGVALGPKPRSYRQHTPKKMVRLALLSALSDRAATNRIALVDHWGWDGPKTKEAVAALRNLKVTGSVLVVLADDETVASRSFANLPNATTTSFGQLSAHDVLRNDWILFSDRTLPGSDAFVGAADAPTTSPTAAKPEPAVAAAPEEAVSETEEAAADA
jgi:large subunit ribosomal protein L4